MDMKWMCIIYSLVGLVVSSTSLIRTECDGSICLYLYENGNTWRDWQRSYNFCRDEGLQLVRIENDNVQSAVAALLNVVDVTSQRDVWTAGRGSGEDIWRYMNGTTIHNPEIINKTDAGLYCMFITLYRDQTSRIEYTYDNCDERNSPSRVLCQYDPITTDPVECYDGDALYGGKCYRKTIYGAEGNRADWFKAQSICNTQIIYGTIAYSNFEDGTFFGTVRYLFGNPERLSLWFGVRRRIWHWRIAEDTNDRAPMNYFNWVDDSGRFPVYQNCVYIDNDKGDRWSSRPCNDYLKYFICMNESAPVTSSPLTTTPTTRETSVTSVTSSNPSQDMPECNTTAGSDKSNDKEKQPFSLIYIAPVVIGVVVVAVIIGVTVFCVRKRKQHKPSEEQENESQHGSRRDPATEDTYSEVEAAYSMASAVDDAEYADIEPVECLPDNSISPYAEVGIGKRMSAFLKKKLNIQKPNKHTMDAKPRAGKKLREKIAMDSGAKMSQGETSTNGKKAVKHIETEQGDEYAIVDKSGNLTDDTKIDIEHIVTEQGDVYALPMKK